MDDLDAAAEATYHLARQTRRLRGVLLVEYRCPKGCLLLHAWRSPAGVLGWRPPYRSSPALNAETSTAEGRASNTSDGERRWRGHAFNLDSARSWEGHALPLTCDHTPARFSVPTASVLADADAATPGRPTRRIVGARAR